jgi:hypothetical protein
VITDAPGCMRLGAYVKPKYINVSSTESTFVKKSVEGSCKSDPLEG